jgi:MFS family permease
MSTTNAIARTFSSLGTRNFRLFFVGQLISNSGNWLTTVALTLLVLHRSGSGTAVGLLSACQFGPILILSAWAGLLADRSNKRRLLYVTQALEMVQSFVLAILAFAHAVPLSVFYLVALAGGVLLAIDNPARRSFVNEMVPTDQITNAVTLYSAMVALSRVIGPLVAGVLIVTLSYGWGFAIDGASYLVVIAALVMMRPAELRPSHPAPRGPGQIRSGLRYVRQVPELWISFITLLIIGLASYNFTVVIPLFVEHGLHGSDTQYTIVYAAFSVGGILGTLAIARRTVVTLRAVISGAAGLGISLLILVVVPDVGWALPATALVGGTSVAYMTATTALAQLRSDRQMIGRVLALQTVLMIGTTPIGGPFLGWLADAVGARAPVLFGGVAALAAAAFAILAGRGHLKTGQPETPTEPATPPANPTPSSSAAAD